jgi:PAS domain S-box-containing protein
MRRQHAMRGSSSAAGEARKLRLHFAVDAPGSSPADIEFLESTLKAERKRSIEPLRVLFENSADALFVVSIDASDKFHLEEFNPAFARLFGVSSRADQGDAPHQLLPAAIAEPLTSALDRCRQSGRPTRLELSLAGEGGIARWEFLLTPVQGFLGRLERITGHGHTRRDEQPVPGVEGAVQDCIARTTRDLLYVFDRTMSRSLFLNARVYDVLGYRVDELRDMTREELKALIHPEDLPRLIAHYRKLETLPTGAVVAIEYRVRHANGRYVWLASKDTALVLDREGSVRKIVGCATDMTDQRHALAEVKKISKQLLRTQDEERRRIARELHDSTSQHLVAVGIGLTRLSMINERESDARMDREDIQEILTDVRKGITEAQHEIRALSYLLHPPALERMGLCQTLRRFAAGFARRTRIHVDLIIQDRLDCRSHDIATALLRIAQEALINVYRHSNARKVEIRLTSADGRLRLEIEDDGKGIERSSIASDEDIDSIGVGIPGMRARVRQFHGELDVLCGQGGVLVRATIPDRPSRLC